MERTKEFARCQYFVESALNVALKLFNNLNVFYAPFLYETCIRGGSRLLGKWGRCPLKFTREFGIQFLFHLPTERAALHQNIGARAPAIKGAPKNS